MAKDDTGKGESKFKRLVTNRTFLMTVTVIALALLIWFVGDAFAMYSWRPLEAGWARLLLIIIVALGFIGWEVLRWYRARKANEALLTGISESELEADVRAADEIKVLKTRFEEAAQLLKTQKFEGGHGKKTLINELPWYIFIGAPGSGKTTALMHCGLKFPLSGRDGPLAIKGVGGTRNCDWWFTNQAVFLDTAGRYTTQESNQRADSKSWLGFLELLKRFRPALPLNGAIVTLSVSDLLTFDETGLKRYADSVRARIQELYEKLGVAFPIYLVVTKTDLLAGFAQYFSDLGAEERSQVWGCTFPYQGNAKEGQNYSATFETEFRSLERRVFERLVERTVQERDNEARALIYNFPGQFSTVGPLIKQFIELAFQSSRFDRAPLLRGLYFTSGTQEGAPIDRVLGTLSRSMGLEQRVLPPSAVTGKSYFLKRLLEDVVFAEAGLVGFDEKRERRSRLTMRAAFAALALFSVAMAAAWTVSYFGNRQLIAQTRDQVAAVVADLGKLPSNQADLAQTLAALNKIRDLPYGYAERERSGPLMQNFGLFQGDKLGTLAIDSYRRVLGQTLLPRLALELEGQLRNPADDQVLYEALKAYLMLYDDKHLEPASLEAWVERLLPAGSSAEAQKDLVGHLRAALERRPLFIDFAKNDELIADARQRLANASLADRAFARLKLLGGAGGVNPFRISDAAGPAASQVFVRGSGEALSAPFPAIFTRDGYYKSFKTDSEKLVKQLADEESWVLKREAKTALLGSGTAELVDEVRRRYFSEYVIAWERLLGDIKVKRSANSTESILLARVLSDPDSPLKRLAVAASKETTLLESQELKTGVAAVAESVTDATKSIVSRVVGTSQVDALTRTGRAPELVVDEHFARLRLLVAAPAGKPAPIDQTLLLLGEFSRELADLQSKAASGVTAVQAQPTAVRLKAEAETMPAPVQGILRGLVESAAGQTAAVNTQAIESAIGGGAGLCDKAIPGRYPFVANAKAEVGIDDFNAVFRADGDLDKTFKANLQSLVDTSGPNWKLRESAGSVATVSPRTVTQFQYADAIRQAFFRGSPSAGFSADLIYVTPEIPATFEYDGEPHKLGTGQVNAVKLRWPGQRPEQPLRLYSGWTAGSGGLTIDGTWSAFRLMDKATSDGGKDRIRLTFDVDGKKLGFELRLTSVYNPFKLKELQSFTCPGKK